MKINPAFYYDYVEMVIKEGIALKKVIRRLGLGETWLALLHDKTGGTAQTTMIAAIQGDIDEKRLTNGIHYLLQRYPQLTYTLHLQEEGYYFIADEITSNLINIQYLTVTKPNQWQQLASEEANNKLDATKCLLRVKLLVEKKSLHLSYLFVTIHHAISDGLSLPALLDVLLLYLNDPTIPIIVDPNPGVIEKLYAPSHATNPTLVRELKELDKIQPYTWYHQGQSPMDRRDTHFQYYFLNSEQLDRLHLAAKKNAVTINGILNAAILLSAQFILQQAFNGALSTPVSLRMQTNDHADIHDVGFLLQVIDTLHPNITANTTLISLAKEYNKQIRDRLSVLQTTIDYDFASLKNTMTPVWDPTRAYFCYHFMVTNLGQITFQHESSQCQIKQFRFITCRRAADNNMMLYVSSISSGLFYTFGYPVPAITHEWAHTFINKFNDFIFDFLNS